MAAGCLSLPNIFVFVGMALICTMASAGEGPKAGDAKCVDILCLNSKSEADPLALVHVHQLNPPLTLAQFSSVVEQYKTILPKGENRRSFTDPVGSMAFMVMRPKAGLSAKALRGEKVVGVVYAHLAGKDIRPEAFWSGRLVHSRSMERIYLVLARSEGTYLTLAIFPVDSERNIGKYPMEFPLDNLASWTKPLQAVTEKVIHFEQELAADIREINVTPDKNGLVIAAQLAEKARAPLYFRYDFDKKTWTTAKIAVGDPLK